MAKPKQRSALEVLTKKRLTRLAKLFELKIPASRPKADFVEAIASSRRAGFAAILGQLNRSEIKDICHAHGLDDSGKDKAAVIARILGEGPGALAPSEGKSKPLSRKADAEVDDTGGQPNFGSSGDSQLTMSELENHLWLAADILRGSIHTSDYQLYVSGLLLIKRLSDRFEEVEARTAAGEAPEVTWSDPAERRELFVPERARWSTLQRVDINLGEALNKACMALEQANGALEGVLADIDYNDLARLGDSKTRDDVLGRLIHHFSRLSLRNADLSEPDMLGRAYEHLIETFANDAGKMGGEFYTPHMVARLVVELLAPREGMRVCDPTCGFGGMLLQCAKYVEHHGGDARTLALHGQERNHNAWAICKTNMLLHGRSARIESGDTIRHPKLVGENGELITYDRVIANPPFSLREWGVEVAERDRYGRFGYGLPPRHTGDLAFVQHMLAVTNAGGKLGVIVPQGVLFRGGAERLIREKLLRQDLVEAVIGLPAGLFYGTGIPAAVLVLSRGKAEARRGKVLVVNASQEYEEDRRQNRLREQDVMTIVGAFVGFVDIEKYAQVVRVEEIEANDFELTISRYVYSADRGDVRAAVERSQKPEKARRRRR